jgi:hypothetical protein
LADSVEKVGDAVVGANASAAVQEIHPERPALLKILSINPLQRNFILDAHGQLSLSGLHSDFFNTIGPNGLALTPE